MEARPPAIPEEEIPRNFDNERETSPEPDADEASAFSLTEGRLAAEAIKKHPVIAFEHAAKAAETDEALEKEYETRHEVKDEPASQQPVSIASVLAKLPARQPSLSKSAPSKPPITPAFTPTVPYEQPEDSQPTQAPSYIQAIKFGFAAAVGLILIFIIAQVIS